VAGHDKSAHGMMWTPLQVREARNRTSRYAGVSRHGVRLSSKGRTLVVTLNLTAVESAGRIKISSDSQLDMSVQLSHH